jgi:hypothetical protein
VSVALFTQHAKRIGRFILSFVAYLAVQYFLHQLKKARFSEKVVEHKMRL